MPTGECGEGQTMTLKNENHSGKGLCFSLSHDDVNRLVVVMCMRLTISYIELRRRGSVKLFNIPISRSALWLFNQCHRSQNSSHFYILHSLHLNMLMWPFAWERFSRASWWRRRAAPSQQLIRNAVAQLLSTVANRTTPMRSRWECDLWIIVPVSEWMYVSSAFYQRWWLESKHT